MMNNSNSMVMSQELQDKISLYEFGQVFFAGWRWLLGGVGIGLAIGASYLSFMPAQYEASLLIKIGQIARVNYGEQSNQRVQLIQAQIESPDQVAERVKLSAFQNKVLKSLQWEDTRKGGLYRASIQATRRNDFVEVRLRGITPEDARMAGEATLIALMDDHRRLSEVVVLKTKAEIADLVSEISEVEAILSRLAQIEKKITSGTQGETLMWLQMVQDQRSRLRNLRRQMIASQEALSLMQMMPTTVIEPISVSANPVYPKVRQTWLLAVIGGFLLGVMVVLLRIGLRRDRDDACCA